MLLVIAFIRPLEVLAPANPGQPFLRKNSRLDLWFLLGQYLVWSLVVYGFLTQVHRVVQWVVPDEVRQTVAGWSWGVQAVVAILASDFCVYWGHRLQHRVEWLWRFHAVHHSAEHLDWLAAHREHPVDTIYTGVMMYGPIFLLGFPLETLTGFFAFRGMWAIYIHSNVRLPLGPLRVIIGSPELHHWHHAKNRRAGNYGNLTPIMDWLFGTYTCPDHEPPELGLTEPTPTTYLGHLLTPFYPSARRPVTADASSQG